MLKLYNSLTRDIEVFKPIHPDTVGVYTCGPTVYQFATIGNFRTYTAADILIRVLKYNGFSVKYIMNLTDVGHLTGDNLGDADIGEDRMEKSAQKEGKTAWEVAAFYTDAFLKDYEALGLTKPQKFVKATDHIHEQIELIEDLEKRGYTYRTSDGIYFDTAAFPTYGQLSSLDQIKEGARVEVNPEKKNPRDFALWKFSYPYGVIREAYIKELKDNGKTQEAETLAQRQMEWDSPWGVGFPGWHIECSAMSMKYLGDSFDIHTGGIDLKETHHPNEIAQSEAATGKKFVNYWVHAAFLLVNGQKMSKSLGNVYKLYDLEKEGFDPLALRYLYLQTHYRQEMNFTFPALEAAQNALNHLRQEVVKLSAPKGGLQDFEDAFSKAINEDLNTPEALAVVWDMLKAGKDTSATAASLFEMDHVLGLGLEAFYQEQSKKKAVAIPKEVRDLVEIRQRLRKERSYAQADQVRNKIKKLGFDVADTDHGPEITKL